MATPQLFVDALLTRQAGVVSRAQARQAGLAGGQIDRLVARRRWRPVHPRVYLAAHHELTDQARLWAAVLWAGPGAVPSGRAALWWHGLLPCAPGSITLRTPRRVRDPPAGVVVWSRPLGVSQLVTLRGLTLPVRPLALLDAAVETGVLPRSPVDLTQLHAVADHAISPAAARRLLADVSFAPPGDRAEWQTYRNRYS